MDTAVAGPDRAARSPRYQRIADELREGIASGVPPMGGTLPSEDELCRRFEASRYTIRAALKLLEEAGLLLRRTGARSTVIAQRPREAFTQTIAGLGQLLNYPADTLRHNLCTGFIAADEALATMLECEPGRSWFRISAVRRSPAHVKPLAWVEIYLLPEYAAVAKRRDHETSHVYEQVERQFGESIARARIEMLPSSIPTGIAAHLEVEPGSPALMVIRRYVGNDGRVFETTRTLHPEGRYVFSMELARRRTR